MVDHGDQEETRIFRSLLSYLLTSPASSAPPAKTPAPTLVVPEAGSYSSDEASPMKMSAIDDESGETRLDEAMSEMLPAPRPDQRTTEMEIAPSPSPARSVVSMEEDPIEHEIAGGKAPSAERYKERTAVFEQLMAFINEDAKQPDKDLLRMINVDQGDF